MKSNLGIFNDCRGASWLLCNSSEKQFITTVQTFSLTAKALSGIWEIWLWLPTLCNREEINPSFQDSTSAMTHMAATSLRAFQPLPALSKKAKIGCNELCLCTSIPMWPFHQWELLLLWGATFVGWGNMVALCIMSCAVGSDRFLRW